MTVYEAISKMRQLSELRQSFSFTFMSWSETKQSTHGIVEVRQARLITKSKDADHLNADYLQPYIDLDTLEHKRFYAPFLMTFNGQRLQLTLEPEA